jgi:pyruvate dehydrogenase E1 component alpha subunit
MTYRWRGHVGPNDDLDKGLRSKEELDYWMSKCPIRAFEEFILARGIISDSERIKIIRSIDKEIEDSVTFAKNSPYPDEHDYIKYVFKT